MPDRGAERHEKRPRPLEIGRLGADQQCQFSRSSGVRQAGDRAVDIDETARAQIARQIERVPIGNGRTLDRQRARFGCFGRTILAEPHRAGCFVIGDHGDDSVRAIGGVRRRIGPARATRDQIIRLGLAAIPDRDGESAVEIAAGHAVAHASETDEGDMGHGLIHVLDRTQAARRRRVAPASPP